MFKLPFLILACAGAAGAKPGVVTRIAALQQANASFLQYPSQFTQGILPIPVHSHNDYWREVPLLTALSYGVKSVEADVWLVDGDLLVGHKLAALTKDRTFTSLYVNPLKSILDGQNPKTKYTVNQTFVNGVFDTSSDIALQLLVEIKTNGNATLPVILRQLAPLRNAGYLTTYRTDTNTLRTSGITVIGTGNTPLSGIQALAPSRDVFYDAPLESVAVSDFLNSTVSPLASTDWATAVGWDGAGNISAVQRSDLARLIGDAHAKGVMARFWDTPAWPVGARNNVWRVLAEEGSDWLNADDLKAASEF